MEPNLKLKKNESKFFHDAALYQRLIGKLLYLTNTQIDLSYYVHLLSQFMDKPWVPHYDSVIKIIKYVKRTPGQGIFCWQTHNYNLWPTQMHIVQIHIGL